MMLAQNNQTHQRKMYATKQEAEESLKGLKKKLNMLKERRK
jgi:hypothetical protein